MQILRHFVDIVESVFIMTIIGIISVVRPVESSVPLPIMPLPSMPLPIVPLPAVVA